MKKLLLIPALMATLASADDGYKQKLYEISPMFGYDMVEGNVGIKDDGHYFGGVEVQFNSKDSKLSPEFSVFYTPGADYDAKFAPKDTSITRTAFNGVYTFDADDALVPFAKAGFGIEDVSDDVEGNSQGFFLDAGVGAKYFFTDNVALKAEALYMAKVTGAHNQYADNHLVGMVGLTIAFGDMPEEIVEPKAEPAIEPAPEPKAEPKEEPAKPAVVVDGDDDNDGVKNSVDECPNTPKGTKVDVYGCPEIKELVIHFDFDSAKIKEESLPIIDEFAEYLKRHDNYRVVIAGHADAIGPKAYNKKLSLRRAQAVVDALVKRGIDPKRLKAEAYGEEKPVADNNTDEGRAKNRRVEAKLTHD